VFQLDRAIGVVTIPVLTVPIAVAMAGPAQATTLPKPPTKTLPSALDVASPYEPQSICDPVAKPGVVDFATLMTTYYKVGNTGGITRNCDSGLTEHSEGRAWDWMLSVDNPDQKAIADSVTAWLSAPDAQGRPGAMARRFGIMYIIWNHRIWGTYALQRGWAPYTGPVPHTDHIHFSFSWDGAYARTSWWTGKALTTTISLGPSPTTPPQAPGSVYSILVVGSTGSDVALAQKVIGATADGIFGPQTESALRAWQASHGVPVTGQLDTATWAAMERLHLVPTRGAVAPAPKPAPAPAPKPAPAPAPAPSPAPAPAPKPAANPLAAYASSTLRRGSVGPAVVALQKAVGATPDGAFGPLTEAAVRVYQARHRLPVTGIAGPSTWAALMGVTSPTTTTASRSTSRPAPAPKPATTTTTTTTKATTRTTTMTTGPLLRLGARGDAVKTLQRALGGVAVDGLYGARTLAAVQAFQKSAHLPVTGIADAGVWRATASSVPGRRPPSRHCSSGRSSPAPVSWPP
jgi:peptidoglycan hydrolase-like protein with peptidoglycan-binding domain